MRRLLIRPGAIGDVIVSLPALEWLKTDYTEVWVPSPTVPLIQFADKASSIASSRIDRLESHFVERFQQFDDVVSWYGSNQDELLAINPRCRFLQALPRGGTIHATDFYAQQVGAPIGLRPKITVESVARETVVIHPFSGSDRKNWPYAQFQALAERLPLPVEWAHDRFENLLDLAQWMAGARLYIGNDSGITHLAAATGTPTIAIFQASEPQLWSPRGATVLLNPSLEQVLSSALSVCGRR